MARSSPQRPPERSYSSISPLAFSPAKRINIPCRLAVRRKAMTAPLLEQVSGRSRFIVKKHSMRARLSGADESPASGSTDLSGASILESMLVFARAKALKKNRVRGRASRITSDRGCSALRSKRHDVTQRTPDPSRVDRGPSADSNHGRYARSEGQAQELARSSRPKESRLSRHAPH